MPSNHVIQPNIDANGSTENNASLIEDEPEDYVKETMKLIKDWRDNYDDDGNPINEDTDDDSTEDDGNTEE